MNQRTELAARIAHETNKAWCEQHGDMSQLHWEACPAWQRISAINGVRALVKDQTMTGRALHISWMAEKKADGWVYGKEKDAIAKTHPCMVPYDSLPREQRVKDALFRGVVLAVLEAVS